PCSWVPSSGAAPRPPRPRNPRRCPATGSRSPGDSGRGQTVPGSTMIPSRTLLLSFALAAVSLLAGRVAAAPEVKVGDRVADLTFKDIRYLPRSLDDFPDAKAFVLVFTNTSCPVVQRYLPTLDRLEKDYRGKGVAVLAVNAAADDSVLDMAAQAVRHEM